MKKIIDVSEIEAVFGKYDDGRLSLSVINDLRALLDKAPTLQDAMLSIVVESAIKMLGNVEISDIKARKALLTKQTAMELGLPYEG